MTTTTDSLYGTADKILRAQIKGAKIENLYAMLDNEFERGRCSTQEYRRIESQLEEIRWKRGE